MLQLEIKSQIRFKIKSPFKCFIELPKSSCNPTFTCIFKTVIPGCHFLGNLQFYLHNPHHTPPVKLKIYGPFLWMGLNCLKATDTLQGDSFLFTTKFTKIPGTHSIWVIWPQQLYHCPVLNNLTIVLYQEMPPISTNEIFSVNQTKQGRNVPLMATIMYLMQI